MATTAAQRTTPGPPPRPNPHPQPDRPEPPRPAFPPQPLPATAAGPVLNADPRTDPVLDRLLDERIIYLGGELHAAAADRIITQLLLLAAQDARRDITFYLNSTGGSVAAGLAVHDTMQVIAPDVATWAVGLAGSMGQLLLTGGAAGKRHAHPHARILLSGDTAPDLASRRGLGGVMRREVAELVARHSGRPVETIVADSGRDRWFTAEEARSHGLVDHVADS